MKNMLPFLPKSRKDLLDCSNWQQYVHEFCIDGSDRLSYGIWNINDDEFVIWFSNGKALKLWFIRRTDGNHVECHCINLNSYYTQHQNISDLTIKYQILYKNNPFIDYRSSEAKIDMWWTIKCHYRTLHDHLCALIIQYDWVIYNITVLESLMSDYFTKRWIIDNLTNTDV